MVPVCKPDLGQHGASLPLFCIRVLLSPSRSLLWTAHSLLSFFLCGLLSPAEEILYFFSSSVLLQSVSEVLCHFGWLFQGSAFSLPNMGIILLPERTT